MSEQTPSVSVIASRRFRARRSGGEELEIELGVGQPVEGADGGWTCGVVLKGLYGRLADLQGVDSWQALMLALNLARELLSQFVEGGGQLMDVQTGVAVTNVADIFSLGKN